MLLVGNWKQNMGRRWDSLPIRRRRSRCYGNKRATYFCEQSIQSQVVSIEYSLLTVSVTGPVGKTYSICPRCLKIGFFSSQRLQSAIICYQQELSRYRWTVPKYRSNSVYTSSYKRHHTVQYRADSQSVRGRSAVSD